MAVRGTYAWDPEDLRQEWKRTLFATNKLCPRTVTANGRGGERERESKRNVETKKAPTIRWTISNIGRGQRTGQWVLSFDR